MIKKWAVWHIKWLFPAFSLNALMGFALCYDKDLYFEFYVVELGLWTTKLM